MRITDVHVEGFGVWRGLRITDLDNGINVIFGPNEAGKTTLLEFIRGVFYGFKSGGTRYLNAVPQNKPRGGSLRIRCEQGQFEVSRRCDASGKETLSLVAADGTHYGEHYLNVLLGEAGESLFRNVFAVGLDEIQTLASLSGTEAAELLYRLSLGIDPHAPVNVLRDLEQWRLRLYDGLNRSSQIGRLLEQRSQTLQSLEELAHRDHGFWRAMEQARRLRTEVRQFEAELQRVEERIVLYDAAVRLYPLWQRRKELIGELQTLDPVTLPAHVPERLAQIERGMARIRQRIADCRKNLNELSRRIREEKVSPDLLQSASRISALCEQEPRLIELSQRADQWEKTAIDLQTQFALEAEQCGMPPDEPIPMIARAALHRLQRAAETIRRIQSDLENAKEALKQSRRAADDAQRKLRDALRRQGVDRLNPALEEAGRVAAQWRRRVQIEERIEQLHRYRSDLEEESRRLAERQLMPIPLLAGLAAVFALGVMLFLLALVFPSWIGSGWGLTIAALGIAGSAAAALSRWFFEKHHTQRLDNVVRQMELLKEQIHRAEEERETLDRELPKGVGSPAARSKEAEDKVAKLESLLPLEGEVATAEQAAQAAEQRVSQAEEQLNQSQRRWQDALRRAGIPQEWSPANLRRQIAALRRLRRLQRQARRAETRARRIRHDLETFGERVAQCAAESGVAVHGSPLDRLRQLRDALSEAEAVQRRRELIVRQRKNLIRQMARLRERLAQWKHRRRALWAECGTESERQLLDRIESARRANETKTELERIDREIEVALGGRAPRTALIELFESGTPVQWSENGSVARARAETIRREIERRLAQCGEFDRQLAEVASDRTRDRLRLQLGALDDQLRQAADTWRLAAVLCRAFDEVRRMYETERQPQTLATASQILAKLTGGRYRRVWTPLDEDTLLIESVEGHSLRVDALSRGTREQLFLALRLALADYFSHNGIDLPLTLDDVLVNFDPQRLASATEVLSEFAANRQVILFTCHESLCELLAAAGASFGRLPRHWEHPLPPIRLKCDRKPEPASFEEPTRRRRTLASSADVRPLPKEKTASSAADPYSPTDQAPIALTASDAAEEAIDTTAPIDGDQNKKLDNQENTDAVVSAPSQSVTHNTPNASGNHTTRVGLSETVEADAIAEMTTEQPTRRKLRRKPPEQPSPAQQRPGKPRAVFDADYFASADESS